MSSRFSSAAFSPISGLAPAPNPLVSFSPICKICGALHIFNTDPLRPKKLLLHKSQIRHLAQEVGKMGYSLIPLSVYLKDGRFKMELGLCKGKKLHDKRDSIAERDTKREMQRALRSNNRYD